jgi:hypothetical protein
MSRLNQSLLRIARAAATWQRRASESRLLVSACVLGYTAVMTAAALHLYQVLIIMYYSPTLHIIAPTSVSAATIAHPLDRCIPHENFNFYLTSPLVVCGTVVRAYLSVCLRLFRLRKLSNLRASCRKLYFTSTQAIGIVNLHQRLSKQQNPL